MSDLSFLDIPSLLQFQFFQFALLAGIIAGFATAWLGLFLILRKEAMIGDGIAHTAFGGIALGVFLGIEPMITALLISILAVMIVSTMKRKGLAQADAAIAVMLALGFSSGLIIIGLAGGFNRDLLSYLFGSLLTIDMIDLIIVSFLGLITVFFLGLFYKELLSMTFDEKSSQLLGIPVRPLTLGFNLLVAVTITLSIKIIGVILVVALLVIPGLTALQFQCSFKKTVMIAILLGIISMIVGIFLSVILEIGLQDVLPQASIPPTGMIVFTAVCLYIGSIIGRRFHV
jgi:zinc transport system permease protein